MERVVFVQAYVPPDLEQEFLQHIRNFDASHPNCHFKIMVATAKTTQEVERVLDSITPPFAIRDTQLKS